jgi:Zn-dependent alcohol dehydrogenase
VPGRSRCDVVHSELWSLSLLCGAKANLCDLGSIMAIGPQLDGTYRMHLDGRDVHQFLTISTLSAWSVVSELSVWRSLTTCPSKRSAFLVAELAPVLGPPSPPSYTLVTRSL